MEANWQMYDWIIGQYVVLYFTLEEGIDGDKCSPKPTQLFTQSYYCKILDAITYNGLTTMRLNLPDGNDEKYFILVE